MANKFFGADDDSDSDKGNKFQLSDNEDSSPESSKEEESKKLMYYGSSDESEDEKRVVKPEKLKRLEGLQKVFDSIINHTKINDFVALEDDFENINKEKDKCKDLISSEPNIMKLYIKSLGKIEQCINGMQKEDIKKLKVSTSKSFHTLKNKMKKQNKDYEEDIKKFQENPNAFEIEIKQEKHTVEMKEDEAESSSSDEFDFSVWKNQTPAERRQRWVKKEKKAEKEEDGEDKPKIDKKKETTESDKKESSALHNVRKKTDDIEVTEKIDDLTIASYVESVERRITQGKEKDYLLYASEKILNNLRNMFKFAKHSNTKEKIVLSEILQRSEILHSMQLEQIVNQKWGEFCEVLNHFCEMFSNKPYIEHSVIIHMYTYLDSLNAVLYRALQLEDHPSGEYISLLRYENCLLLTIHSTLQLMKRVNATQQSLIATMYLDHIYFKSDKFIKHALESNPSIEHKEILANEKNSELVKELYHIACRVTDEETKVHILAKTKAMLMYVYNLCINNNFAEAKRLLYSSKIQYVAQACDSYVQILYNRCIVQLGIAAFKTGDIEECHTILTDLCSHNKFKDLLGQNLSKIGNEKIERKDSIPLHLHINLDLVESVHLICGMLLEAPNLAKERVFSQSKVLNKAFRKMLDSMQKNVYYFTSESVRESIFYATQALQQGDWNECFELIKELPIWDMIEEKDKILTNLLSKIKISALVTYIEDSKVYYNSYNVPNLSKMFELTNDEVKKEFTHLLLHNDIVGYIEEETLCITGIENTPTENLINHMFYNAEQICANNERIAEKHFGYKLKPQPLQHNSNENFFGSHKAKKKP